MLLLTAAAGCQSIRVRPVDYTFKTPLVTAPVGMKAVTDRRADFAQIFCKALKEPSAGGAWGSCDTYLELMNFTPDAEPLPPLIDAYQIVIVPGIFSACLPPSVTIYKQGIEALKRDGLTSVTEIPVSASGGSEANARLIAQYVHDHVDPKRPFIALGYSQGAADLLQAYATDDVVRSSVAALITVAGAAGGSRLPDALPSFLGAQLKDLHLNLPQCRIDGLAGIDTLRRKTRYDFLAEHQDRLPRSYSIAAKSGKATTSKALVNGWTKLSAYSIDQDSQMIRDDAMVPGGSFLGTALGDHWAVALPFSEAHDPLFDRIVDHNIFPRTSLLEAAVRFVMKDLKERP